MYFEEMKVGMAVQTAQTVIEKEKMMDFARNYDCIPLHLGNVSFSKVSVIDRDGSILPAEFEKEGHAVTIRLPFGGLSSRVLIFE